MGSPIDVEASVVSKTKRGVMSYAFERDILKSRENCHKVNLLAKYPTVVPVKVTGNMIFSHKDVPEGYSYLGCCDHRSENNDMHYPCSLYSTIEGMMFDVRESVVDKSLKRHLQAPAFLSVGSSTNTLDVCVATFNIQNHHSMEIRVIHSVPVDAYSTNRDVYVSGDNLRSCLEVRDAYNRDASFLSDIEREMSEALVGSQAIEAISLLARFALGMDDKDTDTRVLTEFASSLRSIAETLENTARRIDDCLCDECSEDDEEDDYCDDSEDYFYVDEEASDGCEMIG